MQILEAPAVTVLPPASALPFTCTQSLLSTSELQLTDYAWQLQPEAQKTLMMGLSLPAAGSNVLVLGTPGSGRASLTLSAMQTAARHTRQPALHDVLAVYHPTQGYAYLQLPVGQGRALQQAMDAFVKALITEIPQWLHSNGQGRWAVAEQWLQSRIQQLHHGHAWPSLNTYFDWIAPDILHALRSAQSQGQDSESIDSLLNDGFLSRFRVNLLVDQQSLEASGMQQPVVVAQDPGWATLFGSLEGASGETAQLPEFLRLRAGSLQRAQGGFLLLYLRDFMQDEANGAALLEKLYRLMRHRQLVIEDWANASQQGASAQQWPALTLDVKLVMIASREDYYDCLDAQPDFFDFFPVKVEFEDRVTALPQNYACMAGYIGRQSEHMGLPPFSQSAVQQLLQSMHRLEEDQGRLSTRFSHLDQLMQESASVTVPASLVTEHHVRQALSARLLRQQFFETQIRDSIIDNELLIQVHGQVVGQVNGLTHIELGDASFGSPIRITARCYPGRSGVINIDREVNMSGPNHDKGIYILQNWLSASFWSLAPLSLNASLVFEQEYNGVEGDSASCAELFALLSALTHLPVRQGIAVTGALNQFGEVMPIGGVNEKIEGYFRVCQALGLDGEQGVIIPKRNVRHLVLDEAVVEAVARGQFKIIAIDHVLEGIACLTGAEAGTQSVDGTYTGDTIMARAQAVLADYRHTLERNQARLVDVSSS